ncbi:MAG TPA: TIM barrel protein [Longimicrobiaceae bacterium]
MRRRDFVRAGLAGAAGMAVPGVASATGTDPVRPGEPFKLNYAPHFGMFRHSAGNDPIDQIRYMHEVGFRAIEDNGMMGRDPALQERIGNELARLGMRMGVFVVSAYRNSDVWAVTGDPQHTEHFVATCREAVEVAKRTGAKWMTVVPGNFDRRIPIGIQTANVIEVLRRGAEVFEPHGLVMVLEPLSDTPDLFLREADQTYEICRAVDSPSCKILYDIYHMQRNRGHLIPLMDQTWSEIGYIQIGDNPGRNEPGTGEINYRNIFKHLYDKGFDGILGMEHGNSIDGKEGEDAVIAAYRAADDFPTG